MDIEGHGESQVFINDVDHDTRENIIKLDQKLKGLRAEIEAKVHAITMPNGENSPEYVHGLSSLLGEVDQAIDGLKTLVNLTLTDDQELKNNFFQSEEMHQFSKMMADNLEKIIKIKEKF